MDWVAGPEGADRMKIAVWLAQRQTLSAALLLILALHLCFFPFIWGNKTLLAGSRGVTSVMPDGALYGGSQGPSIYRGNDMGASAWVMEADAPLVRHQYLAEKSLPLWNPYQAYGAPLAANMQSQPFNPLYILFALHPGPRTYNLFILCRFLIAGLCAYLYLRLFLPFAPSLAVGLVCMLSGYHILFFNMPHLSVDVFIPALFLAIERLLRQPSARNVLLAVAVIFLAIAGGMPESTLLLLTFACAYFLFRLFSDLAIRSAARRHMASFVSVNLLGFALAAFFLAPFVEFVRIAFDMHQVRNLGHISGLDHDRFGLSIFTYAVPMLFGTAWKTIAPGLGGYTSLRDFFGILAALFALLAATSLPANFRRRLSGEHRLIGSSEEIRRTVHQLDRLPAVLPVSPASEVRGAHPGVLRRGALRIRLGPDFGATGRPPPSPVVLSDRLFDVSGDRRRLASGGAGSQGGAACVLSEPGRSGRRFVRRYGVIAWLRCVRTGRAEHTPAGRIAIGAVGMRNGRQLHLSGLLSDDPLRNR